MSSETMAAAAGQGKNAPAPAGRQADGAGLDEDDISGAFVLGMQNGLLRINNQTYYVKEISYDYPRRKLLRAIEVFAQGVKVRDIIVAMDDTMLGGAEDGFVVTRDRFYYREMWEPPQSFALKDIKGVGVDKGKVVVHAGGREHRFSFGFQTCAEMARALSTLMFLRSPN
jgi:hypothetical protein